MSRATHVRQHYSIVGPRPTIYACLNKRRGLDAVTKVFCSTCGVNLFLQLEEDRVLVKYIECDGISFVSINFHHVQLILVGNEFRQLVCREGWKRCGDFSSKFSPTARGKDISLKRFTVTIETLTKQFLPFIRGEEKHYS